MGVIWKMESFYKANANEAYKEISKLKEITPQNVVDLARDEKSVIHNDFEWDDKIAGEKYRLHQAGDMIRSFVFEPKKADESPTRVLQITTEKSVYQPVKFFLKNEDEYQSLLKRAKAELESFRRRYSTLTELESVFNAIDKM